MSKNCIFCFTGTGNSYRAAGDFASLLPDCEVIPMIHGRKQSPLKGYSSVGFIFPVYFIGLPNAVREFLEKLEIEKGSRTYFYAIATCGRFSGNAIPQVNRLLKEKGGSLDYGTKLIMGDNYVVMYNVAKNVKKSEAYYKKQLPRITQDVVSEKRIKIPGESRLIRLYHNNQISKVFRMDQGFHINADCNHCGICSRICPAENIKIIDGRHIFEQRCQQCMACIQYCPKRALNYREKTQARRRYRNPEISWKALYRFYHNDGADDKCE